MSDSVNKRKKNYYKSSFGKKSKYTRFLQAGIKGFLCTHNCIPKFCIREAYNILDEFRQKNDDKNQESENAKEDCDDFESELKKDIDNLKKEREENEFQVVETGVTGCVFIKANKGDPAEIVEKIIHKIIDSGQSQTRNILRMIPIELSCKAYMDVIEKAIVPLIDQYFKSDAKSYAIVINRRNNSHIVREELIDIIGTMIQERNISHTVEFKNPDYTILIEILKSICCIAILSNFNKYRKYNLVEIGIAYNKQTDASNSTDNNELEYDDKQKVDDVGKSVETNESGTEVNESVIKKKQSVTEENQSAIKATLSPTETKGSITETNESVKESITDANESVTEADESTIKVNQSTQ